MMHSRVQIFPAFQQGRHPRARRGKRADVVLGVGTGLVRSTLDWAKRSAWKRFAVHKVLPLSFRVNFVPRVIRSLPV
jgi:hypothetical protein